MFKLKMLCADTINGRRLLAGCEIEVDAATARDWISAGRARLTDEADLAVLLDVLNPSAKLPRLLTR